MWVEGDNVHVADRDGQRTLDIPDDLRNDAPIPPPRELLHTAYDMMHSMGIDLAPYTRLFDTFRDRIRGLATAADPMPATFADGLAGQEVLDAIRRSSAERRWVELTSR